MISETEQVQLTPEQELNLIKRLPTYYTLENLKPLWPNKRVRLNQELADIHKNSRTDIPPRSWSSWKSFAKEWAKLKSFEFGVYIPDEVRLFAGTVYLPEDVLNAASKRLFATIEKEPCYASVWFIAFALFNPKESWLFNEEKTGLAIPRWEVLVTQANHKASNAKKVTDAIKDLLQELE